MLSPAELIGPCASCWPLRHTSPLPARRGCRSHGASHDTGRRTPVNRAADQGHHAKGPAPVSDPALPRVLATCFRRARAACRRPWHGRILPGVHSRCYGMGICNRARSEPGERADILERRRALYRAIVGIRFRPAGDRGGSRLHERGGENPRSAKMREGWASAASCGPSTVRIGEGSERQARFGASLRTDRSLRERPCPRLYLESGVHSATEMYHRPERHRVNLSPRSGR